MHERTPFPLFLRSGNDLKQQRPLDRFPTTLFPFFHFILFLCSLPIYTQGPPNLCSFAYGVHSHSERCRLSIRPSVNLDWFHCSDALSLRQERKKKEACWPLARSSAAPIQSSAKRDKACCLPIDPLALLRAQSGNRAASIKLGMLLFTVPSACPFISHISCVFAIHHPSTSFPAYTTLTTRRKCLEGALI